MSLVDRMDAAIKEAVNDEPAEGHSKHDTVDILQDMKVYEATGK